ncbi:MAG: hypothetical protein GTO41_17600, partial [Burkholderiales bacterium]|nr:hypothetical protein [Burkholderiales bacterium]
HQAQLPISREPSILFALSLFMKVTEINRDRAMQGIIDFYFDFSSAYSYVALPKLFRLADERGCKVNWKPIALGVIFKANNHAPPAAETP